MGRSAKRLCATLLTIAVVLLLAPSLVPPFLDRIYYRGPVSDHFDGARFHNPDGGPGDGGHGPSRRWIGFLTGRGRPVWPVHVLVVPAKPAARIGCGDDAMRATWVGHSTVLVQTHCLNILTDPVWSERASPVGFAGPKRVAAPGIVFADLPKIDLVLLSHDHYDHFDVATLKQLWARDRPTIVTGLGNDTILRGYGIGAVARDWGQRVTIRPGIDVIVERVHHWGTRLVADRNRTLWSGFTVTLPGGNLFFAGDTAWGDGQWVTRAAQDGPYRLALLPIGAYLPRDLMRGNHIDPADAARIFQLLGVRHALGIHWGTFQLAFEPFDAAPKDLAVAVGCLPASTSHDFRTVKIGESWDVPR